MEEPIVNGDKISSITTINKFKGVMNDLVRGYPAYLYYGIFESYFGHQTSVVLQFLEEDGIIKTISPITKGEPLKYRVTPKGIDFANSMAQLEYSQKMNKFTKIIILFGIGTFILTLEQILILLLK
jgi:hypothetical protein